MDKYSRTTIREFMNPSNIGSIDEPSGIGHIADEADAVKLTVHVTVGGGCIVDMKYRIAGCTALIAALSVLSKLVSGKTVDEASAIDMQVVSDLLDGLPESKWRCASYALQALHLAIEDYRSRIT